MRPFQLTEVFDNVVNGLLLGVAPVDPDCPHKDQYHVFCEGRTIWDCMLNQVRAHHHCHHFKQVDEQDINHHHLIHYLLFALEILQRSQKYFVLIEGFLSELSSSAIIFVIFFNRLKTYKLLIKINLKNFFF